VDCQVSAFSPFSACSAECGGGVHTATRTVTVPPNHRGAKCPALTLTVACNAQPCPIACAVGAWAWGPCSRACGGGVATATRPVTTYPAHGGTACPAVTASKECNTQACPPSYVAPSPGKNALFSSFRFMFHLCLF
jgi:hypothetical protein